MYTRFAYGLHTFLSTPITPNEAQQRITGWLASRKERFLALVRTAIYGNPTSPYLPLLRNAGCEFGDIKRLVRLGGVEGTLKSLADQGVWISVEEFKGKTRIVRGSASFSVSQHDFDNPFLAPSIEARTSGSRSAGTRTAYDLEFVDHNWSTYKAISLKALGAYDFPFGLWYSIIPGAGPIVLLAYTKAGKSPCKWFAPETRWNTWSAIRNRFATHVLLAAAHIVGMKWPKPEYVALNDSVVVARWVSDTLRKHGGCVLNTYTSAAVRVCQAAKKAGLSLTGATFLFGGEPLTEAKLSELESVGVTPFPMFTSMDAGCIGIGCLNPVECDEVHLFHDGFGFIQRPHDVPHATKTVDALLLSSLNPTTPKILLNVESGDYGVLTHRSCGCEWDRIGLVHHFHTIRGFDKLTSAGMTFIGSDLLHVMEEVLPSRFGGTLSDYQMVEEEDENAQTRMNIFISPEVGEIDEDEVKSVILNALSQGPQHHRMMAQVWADSGTLRLVRAQPCTTSSGKVMPLHIGRTSSPQG